VALIPFPANPVLGQLYTDPRTGKVYAWNNSKWVTDIRTTLEPTLEQLDTYPSLKHAWDEYLVVRKLLGL
jgi:hypothetical protein